jgi:hypothetical protein
MSDPPGAPALSALSLDLSALSARSLDLPALSHDPAGRTKDCQPGRAS